MDVRSYEAGQDRKLKNQRDNESGETTKKVQERLEMVWACYAKRGTLRRKEGDGNESTGGRKRGRPKRRWLDKVKDDTKEKGLSADDVYDHATWRRMSSYIDPT